MAARSLLLVAALAVLLYFSPFLRGCFEWVSLQLAAAFGVSLHNVENPDTIYEAC